MVQSIPDRSVRGLVWGAALISGIPSAAVSIHGNFSVRLASRSVGLGIKVEQSATRHHGLGSVVCRGEAARGGVFGLLGRAGGKALLRAAERVCARWALLRTVQAVSARLRSGQRRETAFGVVQDGGGRLRSALLQLAGQPRETPRS